VLAFCRGLFATCRLFVGLRSFFAGESRSPLLFGRCRRRLRHGGLRMKLCRMRLYVAFVALASARQGFPGEQFYRGAVARRHSGRGSMLSVMFVRLVVLEVLKNVADVEKSVAIQADIHESRLHAGEDACDFSFVDAADESEFFFPLDVDFD